MRQQHAAEALTFSIGEEEAEAFLEQRGLALVSERVSAEIEKRCLVDIAGALVERMTGHFRFALARPKTGD
jgi:hypothetical protein